MKRSAIINALCIPLFLLSLSCEKSNYSPSRTYIPRQEPIQTSTLNLVARNWDRGSEGEFISTLNGVLNYTTATNVNVYVRIEDKDFLISSGGITFMNGFLSAEFVNTDVKLIFRHFGTNSHTPFSELHIKIVFTK